MVQIIPFNVQTVREVLAETLKATQPDSDNYFLCELGQRT